MLLRFCNTVFSKSHYELKLARYMLSVPLSLPRLAQKVRAVFDFKECRSFNLPSYTCKNVSGYQGLLRVAVV
jgi:hypothetical protein